MRVHHLKMMITLVSKTSNTHSWLQGFDSSICTLEWEIAKYMYIVVVCMSVYECEEIEFKRKLINEITTICRTKHNKIVRIAFFMDDSNFQQVSPVNKHFSSSF